jgi:hypothetical protein
MVILIFNPLVLILGLKSSRGQLFYFPYNSSLLIQNPVGNLFGSLVLNIINLLVKNLRNVRVHFDAIHHLLVDCFVKKFTSQSVCMETRNYCSAHSCFLVQLGVLWVLESNVFNAWV